MYNERRDSFSLKDVILQVLFVVLFVFLLMWLFPSKQFVKDTVQPLYDRIFVENILIMKDAAKGYYTNERLPQVVGEKASMTLGKMYDEHLVLPIKDSSGKLCDEDESYVEVTKKDNEYVMKVNLKCSEQENYILVYMGCYDYCKTTICEKNTQDIKSPTIIPTNSRAATPSKSPSKSPSKTPSKTPSTTPDEPEVTPPSETPTPPPGKEYIYEYKKIVNGTCSDWSSNWSKWTIDPKYSTATQKVQQKTEVSGYKTSTERRLVGTKTKTVLDTTKPIYKDERYYVGTVKKDYCKQYGYVLSDTGQYRTEYSAWSYVRTDKLAYVPTDTATTRYVVVPNSAQTEDCTVNCSGKVTMLYRVYQRTSTQVPVKQNVYTCLATGTKEEAVYNTRKVLTGYQTKTVTENVYRDVTVKTPIYTTYYRTKSCKYTSGSVKTKWSYYNDQSLINDGYQMTGNKKEK